MADTGHGQEFMFGSTVLPRVEDIKLTAKGQILSKVVADTALPITATIPGLAKWTVTFNLPATTPQTIMTSAGDSPSTLTGAERSASSKPQSPRLLNPTLIRMTAAAASTTPSRSILTSGIFSTGERCRLNSSTPIENGIRSPNA